MLCGNRIRGIPSRNLVYCENTYRIFLPKSYILCKDKQLEKALEEERTV